MTLAMICPSEGSLNPARLPPTAELLARREAKAARALLEGKHKIELGEVRIDCS